MSRRLLHSFGTTYQVVKFVVGCERNPVKFPKIMWFCCRRNKVSPTKRIEVPDISAVPEETHAATGSSTTSEISATLGISVTPKKKSDVIAEVTSTAEHNFGIENPVALENSTNEGSCEPLTSSSSKEESATHAQSASDIDVEKVGTGAIAEDENQKAAVNSTEDVSEVLTISKRSFGRFDVYCSDDVPTSDVKDAWERPLVILIPWLNAKTRHVLKYSRFYLDRGMDVLHMPVTIMQIMRPQRTKDLVGQLLNLLQKKEGLLANRPLIVHGFSVGGFVWGQILVEMAKDDGGKNDETTQDDCSNYFVNKISTIEMSIDICDSASQEKYPASSSNGCTRQAAADLPNGLEESDPQTKKRSQGKFTDVQQRIIGVVMDSPTPVQNMLDGIPNSFSSNVVIRTAIRGLLASYFWLIPRSVSTHYWQSAETAEANPAGFPMLLLYSSADLIAPSSKLDAVLASWKERGLLVQARKWDDSPHVGHFRYHPEQYKAELQLFLNKLNVARARL